MANRKRAVRRGFTVLGALAALLGACSFATAAYGAPSFAVKLSNDANEVQRVNVIAGAGQFKITFGVDTTPDLPVGATAEEVSSALNALPSIKNGGGSVSLELLGGTGGSEYVVTFDGGPLAHTDVPQMTVSQGTTLLTGLASWVTALTVAPAGVSRSDKRVDYIVNVANTASAAAPAPGAALKCSPETWTGTGSPSFAYRWLRNGTPIGGATSSTYTIVAPSDEGTVIQCQVTATNTVADVSSATDFVGSTRVSSGTVVTPEPTTAAPTPPSFISAPAQTGTLNGTATRELTCNSGSWAGAPTSFIYQWYRNGVAVGAVVGPTAETSAKLTLTAAEQTPPAAFQCTVTATNAGGSSTRASGNRSTAGTLVPNPAAPNNENRVSVSLPNDTSGAVSAEVAVPGGQETLVYETAGSGWSCTNEAAVGSQPAKTTCTRPDKLSPGGSYPPLEVVAGLGADAPDHAVATATVSGGGAATATATDQFDFTSTREFEIINFEANVSSFGGTNYTQAGGHPFAASAGFEFPRYRNLNFDINTNYRYNPVEHVKTVITDLPRGFVGNALAVPELCPGLTQVLAGTCPPDSVVGGITLDLQSFGTGLGPLAIYAIKPEFGEPAQFAFAEGNSQTTYTISPHLRADEGYAITLEATAIDTSFPIFYGVQNVTLCSFGANTRAATGFGVRLLDGCKKATDPTANPKPLITVPTRCTGQPPMVKLNVDSWEHPGDFKVAEAVNPSPTGCEKVDFQPEIKLNPTSRQADTPTGMDVELTMPTEGLEERQGLSQANLDNATVTFPRGMSVNPAAAQGLGACTPEQIKLGSNAQDECPLSSRVGTVEIVTPLIREPLTGYLYLASQNDNPFKSTLGLYMVFSSEKEGITIKVAGKLVADPQTGQLTSVFTENPEAPFSKLVLHLNSGPRAPLVNPPKCGSYAIHSELSPWSAADPAKPTAEEIVSSDSTYQVTSGPNGGPCPAGNLEPSLEAGLKTPTAGAISPFVLRLSREDGTQRFTALDLNMPPGFTAYLKGVPYCPDSVLAGISSAEGTGRQELASPACPAASQIGTVQVGGGAGPFPFYAPGRVYLAGPYNGAPFSIAIVTPAVAGPFDLGNVVVRSALFVDRKTAQVTVKSDPIPTIVHGIQLDVRDIRVDIDRSNFTVAPTSCAPMSVNAQVGGEDGASAAVSDRFQVGECASLKFKPAFKVSTTAKGVSRTNGASLTVKLAQAHGEADIRRVKVELPKALPSRLTTLQKACTEQVFAQNPAGCPTASVVGTAIAHTPILPVPLAGPAYFVSHGGAKFPELILVLQGDGVTIDLAGETFISKAGITSSTFNTVPDAPVESFELKLPQGPDSALAANRDLCGQKLIMPTVITAQNGAQISQKTVIGVQGCPTGLSIKSHSIKRRILTLRVHVPSAGTLTAGGKGLVRVVRRAKGVQVLKLKLTPVKSGKLSTKVKLVFQPTNGKERKKVSDSLRVSFH